VALRTYHCNRVTLGNLSNVGKVDHALVHTYPANNRHTPSTGDQVSNARQRTQQAVRVAYWYQPDGGFPVKPVHVTVADACSAWQGLDAYKA
jgi:hypothetical protein